MPVLFFQKIIRGVSDRYEDASGRSVDDVVEVLKEAGLYKAEVRTDE